MVPKWRQNKQGAALTYVIMVLLLLSTVIVAITALSMTTYSDAVLAISDDQSYYYAKSIGLAVKEQLKDGYNISRIITTLDELEAQRSADIKNHPDIPKITGTFNIADDNGERVNGSVQISYARNDDADQTPYIYVLEVRAACVVNNSLSIVTSIFSCEEDSDEEVDHLSKALTDYDVILTNTKDLSFSFAQANESGTGTSSLSVYVYAGEDDNVQNPEFNLYLNMGGKLTTTGKTTITSRMSGSNQTLAAHSISGNLTSYGDLTLNYTSVYGANGIHVDGNLLLNAFSFVTNDIYARGTVTLATPGRFLNPWALGPSGPWCDFARMQAIGVYDYFAQARSIYAQGNVTLNPAATVGQHILSHGDVYVDGSLDWNIGNTVVGGNIYADGNVYIRKRAIVLGSIYAKGSVYVENGAFVSGNIQSIGGGVYVRGAGVGGQVNCPKGTLSVTNVGYNAGAEFISYMTSGQMVYGGIGLMQPAGVVYKHTCDRLFTGDHEYMSSIKGNLYVESPTQYDYTLFYSVWCTNTVYLKNSTARFVNSSGNRTYVGMNPYGNAYTYIQELNQKVDLAGPEGNPWIDMAGAHIVTLNVGEGQNDLCDAYLVRGWVHHVNARCLFLCDMHLPPDAILYAAQYMHIYGSGANYVSQTYWRGDLGVAYNFLYGRTTLPAGARVDIACRTMPRYEGKFSSETRCGLTVGINTEVQNGALINVGAEWTDPANSYVIIGDESVPASTFFFGGMNAYVGNFKITKNVRLSNWKDATGTGTLTAAVILAEVTGGGNPNYDNTLIRPDAAKNSFYVEGYTSTEMRVANKAGEYRYGSIVQVKGNAYVAGYLYNFHHFQFDDPSRVAVFTNTNMARINGVFVSTGSALNIQGTTVFQEVWATNNDVIVTLTGNLALSAFRVNGTLDVNNAMLTVTGDMYVNKLKSNDINNTYVGGNLTILSINNAAPLTARVKLQVGGDLYLASGSILFDKTNDKVAGTTQAANGDVTISGGAEMKAVRASGNLTVGANGKLKGNFTSTGFILSGGIVAADSGRISGRAATFTHTSGSISLADLFFTSNTASAVTISGGSGYSVYLRTNGGITVTGGKNVDYKTGNVYASKASNIAGGFQCGISCAGNLTIGSDGDTAEYAVGTAWTSDDPTNSGHTIIYSGGSLTWKGKAIGAFTTAPKYSAATSITAKNALVMGSESSPVKGYFSDICSSTSSVEIYVGTVLAVSAATTAKVYAIDLAGEYIGENESGSGIKATGDIHVKGLSSNAVLGGHNQTNGKFWFDGAMDAIARISCNDIEGLGNVKKHNGALYLSIYLKKPDAAHLDGSGFYELKQSLAVHKQYSASKRVGTTWVSYTYNDTGDFSIEGSLKYNSDVRVEGELFVNGTFKYNGSETKLISLGGLYCLNPTVEVTSDFRGNIHLPNVLTITLNADIDGLNAPRVTTINLNHNVSHSLSLTSCDNITIKSGITIGGSLEIKSTGKVVNNGTIGESVNCGTYEGSGSVGKDLILNQTTTSKITGSGSVKGNIWTSGSLDINSTGTFGGKNTYIYAAKDITIQNARFDSGMDYILTTGGNIKMVNCFTFVPKVWNMSGSILFQNHSAYRAEIASVLSYGTTVSFGTGTSTNYQTVKGDVEWHGSASGTAVEFWNSKSTIVEGALKLFGTGNVLLRDAQLNIVNAAHSGTLTGTSSGTLNRLYVNNTTRKTVTSVSIAGKINATAVLYGDSNTTFSLGEVGSSSSDYVSAHGGKSLTVNGKITGAFWSGAVTTMTLNKDVTGTVSVNGGTITTKGAIGGNLRVYNANVYAEGNVSGSVNHTAPNNTSASTMKVVGLGTRTKQITVGGNITVHGRLVDNSKQTTANSNIYVKGAYYCDFQKNLSNTATFNFTSEASGSATILGDPNANWTINTAMNIAGRLVVLTFYKPSKSAWYTVTFTNTVLANALVVNSQVVSGNRTDSAPSFVMVTPENGATTLEDLYTYSLTGNVYKNNNTKKSSTSQQLVIFKKPVFVTAGNGFKGTCHAANAKFDAGSTLYTEGQVSLFYCCFYSTYWKNDTDHCFTQPVPGATSWKTSFYWGDDGILAMDGSMFVHASASTGGDNYFSHVTTNSNLSVYNGISYVRDNSEFKGCLINTSKNYFGHAATKLFYFGASLCLTSGSRIQTAKDRDVDIPAGRTIVWVNKGALLVDSNSYIGYERYSKSPKDDDLNTNRYSFHPGVFVSEESSGYVYLSDNAGGKNYEIGTASIKGSVSLDIMAIRGIDIYSGGVVCAKDSSSSTYKYKAGLYCTKGYVYMYDDGDSSWKKGTSNPSKGGWFGYFSASSGDRHFYAKNDKSGVTDNSVFVPNGTGYASYVSKGYPSDATVNLWCYTPLGSLQPFQTPTSTYYIAPNGIATNSTINNNITTSQGTTKTDTVTYTTTSEKSAPTKPSISVEGTLFGDATVSPVAVKNTTEPVKAASLSVQTAIAGANHAAAADSNITYLGGKAQYSTLFWSSPNYTASVSMTHPSTVWTSSVTAHFDKTKTEYWNTRYVPYTWKLPYYDENNTTTPAKRVLQGKGFEKNGEMDLKTDTVQYYVNESHYAGSSLQGIAGSIRGWRTNGISGNRMWDYLTFNGYDPSYIFSPDDVKRRSKILIFESGELPYSAFYMNTTDDRTAWSGAGGGFSAVFWNYYYGSYLNYMSNKRIGDNTQIAWYLGSAKVSYYDISMVFYTCVDPANPYTSAAKDLHVVLPQGIGFEFLYDAHNTVTVVGNGRVFLYLTSGDTVYFKADAKKSSGAVYARPVGGLKKVGSYYEPLLYIIGAGTNIDLIIEDMPLAAYIYMPFGISTELYGQNGTLKDYNKFTSIANGAKFSTLYSTSVNKTTTDVSSNRLMLIWNDALNSIGSARQINGRIVADNFWYYSSAGSNNLNFSNSLIRPNLSRTTIYDYSTTSDSRRNGKSYSLSNFLSVAPGYSTAMLNWDYKGVRVDA